MPEELKREEKRYDTSHWWSLYKRMSIQEWNKWSKTPRPTHTRHRGEEMSEREFKNEWQAVPMAIAKCARCKESPPPPDDTKEYQGNREEWNGEHLCRLCREALRQKNYKH